MNIFAIEQVIEIANLFAKYYNINVTDYLLENFKAFNVLAPIRFGPKLKYSMLIFNHKIEVCQIPAQYGDEPEGWGIAHSSFNYSQDLAFYSEIVTLYEIEKALCLLRAIEVLDK